MEPEGIFSKIYGECPIPKMMKYDGANGGTGAGRICWMAANSLSRNKKIVCRNNRVSCMQCEFYLRVQREENPAPALENVIETDGTHKISAT
jgi:hypothetical protein